MKKYAALSWITIGITIPLLAMLAWNQFNWLEERQLRNNAQIKHSMYSSAQELSNRVKEELLFFPTLMRLKPEELSTLDESFAERYSFWQYYAISKNLIKDVFVVEERSGIILQWDGSRFTSKHERTLDSFETRSGIVFLDGEIHLTFSILETRNPDIKLVCVLDGQILEKEVLPQIANSLLANNELFEYRIVNRRSGNVIYESGEKDREGDFAQSDVEIGLLERIVLPEFQASPTIRIFRSNGGYIDNFAFIRERLNPQDGSESPPDFIRENGQFIIQIMNKDGTLEDITRRTTVQNAILSFGVVLLLVLVMISLAEGNRRANILAKSQQEFIATITHELKTPLAVISSAAENMVDGLVKDRTKAEQYGIMIKNEAKRLGFSIEHFLLYSNTSNTTRIKPEPCDLSQLLQSALQATEEQRKTHEFRTEVLLPQTPIFIMGDRLALESVFRNLVENVVKHANCGKYLGIITNTEEKRVIIKIRDKGPGIPSKEQKTVFEAFVRGKTAVEGHIPGNGIGLNLVKRIVAMHGGTIALDSKPDIGSTFIVTLPVDQGAHHAAQDLDD